MKYIPYIILFLIYSLPAMEHPDQGGSKPSSNEMGSEFSRQMTWELFQNASDKQPEKTIRAPLGFIKNPSLIEGETARLYTKYITPETLGSLNEIFNLQDQGKPFFTAFHEILNTEQSYNNPTPVLNMAIAGDYIKNRELSNDAISLFVDILYHKAAENNYFPIVSAMIRKVESFSKKVAKLLIKKIWKDEVHLNIILGALPLSSWEKPFIITIPSQFSSSNLLITFVHAKDTLLVGVYQDDLLELLKVNENKNPTLITTKIPSSVSDKISSKIGVAFIEKENLIMVFHINIIRVYAIEGDRSQMMLAPYKKKESYPPQEKLKLLHEIQWYSEIEGVFSAMQGEKVAILDGKGLHFIAVKDFLEDRMIESRIEISKNAKVAVNPVYENNIANVRKTDSNIIYLINREEMFTIESPSQVTELQFSPKGELLVSVDNRKNMTTINNFTGKIYDTFALESEYEENITQISPKQAAVSFTKKENYLVSALIDPNQKKAPKDQSRFIEIWDLIQGSFVKKIDTKRSNIFGLTIFPGDEKIAYVTNAENLTSFLELHIQSVPWLNWRNKFRKLHLKSILLLVFAIKTDARNMPLYLSEEQLHYFYFLPDELQKYFYNRNKQRGVEGFKMLASLEGESSRTGISQKREWQPEKTKIITEPVKKRKKIEEEEEEEEEMPKTKEKEKEREERE